MTFLIFLLGFLLALVAMEWGGESNLLRSHFCLAKCSLKKHYAHFSWRVATVLCVAIFGGLVACGLYVWEIEWSMLKPLECRGELLGDVPLIRYFIHLILFCALAAATLVDFRHLIIPDRITIPATIFAIVILATFPAAVLPVTDNVIISSFDAVADTSGVPIRGWLAFNSPYDHFLTHTAEHGLMRIPDIAPLCDSLSYAVSALVIVWFAIFALLDRVWYARLKFRYAAAIFARYLIRSPRTIPLIILGIIASMFVVGVMNIAPHENRVALFSSLVGMAVGAGMIWGVRIVGTWALRREAMGFGDVTLMGMIGAFLGWQPCVAIFFLAPFVGIAFLLLQGMRRADVEIPYGPSLCAATVLVVIFWRTMWQQLEPLVSLGIMLPLVLLACLILLWLILTAWRSLRNW